MVGDLRGKGLYVREKYPVRLGELVAKVTHLLRKHVWRLLEKAHVAQSLCTAHLGLVANVTC